MGKTIIVERHPMGPMTMRTIGLISCLFHLVFMANGGGITIGSQSGYQYDGAGVTPYSNRFEWQINVTEYIEIEGADYVPGNPQGIFTLTTNYTMPHRNYDVELFMNDCMTAPTPQFPLIFETDNFINDVNTSTNVNNIYMEFTYNQTIIQGSDFWTDNTTRGGDVDFCIRVTNYVSTSSETFMNVGDYLEIIYKIEVDTTTGFHSDLFIYRTGMTEAATEYIDYEDEIEAYQCDDNFNKLLPPPDRTSGEIVSICAETVVFSEFEVHSMKDMILSQDNRVNPPTLLSIQYVKDYVDNIITETDCTGINTTEAICKTKFLLVGEFFEDPVPTYIDITGTVKLELYMGGRRLFKDVPFSHSVGSSGYKPSSEYGRELTDESGSFSVQLGLVSTAEAERSAGTAFYSHIWYYSLTAVIALVAGSMLTI